MTKHVDTAFERHFSEPPVVAVKEGRTHCEACKEPLDPTVMHKCHGNQEYQAPVFSSTEVTEPCPECDTGEGKLHEVRSGSFVVVCATCRTYLYPDYLTPKNVAINSWNFEAATKRKGVWPIWRADLPGDDERENVIQSEAKPSHPDLTNYQGACPAVHVEGETCDWCENTGTIPPTKLEGAQ
jgi:hypothetical protein